MWRVDYCTERDDYYEVKLINEVNGNERKFQLSRKSEYSQAGKWAYYFSENGKKLHSAITADYMKDKSNFLSGLGTILQFG
jgi:hypothetical protein